MSRVSQNNKPDSGHPHDSAYRPDVDGLRALAILPVVAFHAFPERVSGGFIGVDVFFVISGYLISSIILGQMAAGRFSLGGFYARRVRRIFPALIAVLSAVLLFGLLALLPAERQMLGMQLAAGAGFITNIALWHTFGYFAPATDALPLMHLWSLGIEEQFYIVWPLLLLLSFRTGRGLFAVLALFAVGSFAANLASVYGNSTTAFYLPHCRVWEMAVGGMLAQWLVMRPASDSANRNLLSATGLLLLGLGLLLINKERYFPGWWCLLPVGGAACLIAAGPSAWLNRHVLGNRGLVAVGLISYPLYLWHWPLLSYARILEEATPSVTIRLLAVGLSFVLAALTYWLIEQPVRRAPRSRGLVAGLCFAMLALLGTGLYLAKPETLSPEEQLGSWTVEEDWIGWQKCHGSWDCRVLDPARPVDVAVIGDSHAGHLGTGLLDIFRDSGMNVTVRQRPMCMPLFSLQMGSRKYFDCLGFIDKALQESIESPSIHEIVLSGYANNFIYKYPDGVPGNPNLRDIASDSAGEPNPEHLAALAQALDVTLDRLSRSGKRIVFLVDNPEITFEPRECVSARRVSLPGHELRSPCAIERAVYEKRAADYLRLVADAEKRFPAVAFVRTDEVLCDADKCWVMKDGVLLYSDRSHLTPAGSRYVLNRLKDRIR